MRPRNRAPAPPAARRRHAPAFDPYYGHGYRPDFPSITAVAHDEANGGRVLVTTDRPCALIGPAFPPDPAAIPLDVLGLAVLRAETVLPVKFRLWLAGPVARGAAWRWAAGGAGLVDPATGHPLNAAAGDCADWPGPYAPIPPAAVVATALSGTSCTLTFDRPVALTDPAAPDDAVAFDGVAADSVVAVDGYTLSFILPVSLPPGAAWAIARQPDWITTPVEWPQAGTF